MRTSAIVFVLCLAAASCDRRPAAGTSDTQRTDAPAQEPAATGTGDRAGSPPAESPGRAIESLRPAPTAADANAARRAIEFREVTLPAGTTLPLRLESTVASDSSAVEDAVRATVRRDVSLDEAIVLPAGTEVSGVVTAARKAGKVKGRALVAFRFDTLTLDAEPYDIQTRTISRQARATKAKDAKTIGIPAAGGAAVGAIVGGKKGAAIGAAAGGGAGTAVVLSTRGEEVRLPAGTSVTARLSEPLTVRVPVTR